RVLWPPPLQVLPAEQPHRTHRDAVGGGADVAVALRGSVTAAVEVTAGAPGCFPGGAAHSAAGRSLKLGGLLSLSPGVAGVVRGAGSVTSTSPRGSAASPNWRRPSATSSRPWAATPPTAAPRPRPTRPAPPSPSPRNARASGPAARRGTPPASSGACRPS